jgi:hypothetical protein
MLELNTFPLEDDLLETLHPPLKKNKHPPLAISRNSPPGLEEMTCP